MNKEFNTINDAISNLEKTSEVLAEWADNPKNYNSEFAHILCMISLEMRNQASTLKEANYIYGII